MIPFDPKPDSSLSVPFDSEKLPDKLIVPVPLPLPKSSVPPADNTKLPATFIIGFEEPSLNCKSPPPECVNVPPIFNVSAEFVARERSELELGALNVKLPLIVFNALFNARSLERLLLHVKFPKPCPNPDGAVDVTPLTTQLEAMFQLAVGIVPPLSACV